MILSACSPAPEATEKVISDTNLKSQIQLLEMKPADAINVKTARATLKPGDKAVVFGQIGGLTEPFLDGHAGFVMGDTDIEFCDEMGDDHCSKPWDACCEDPDLLKVSRASVQFVDDSGDVIAQGMEGFAGLAGLSHVIVTGEVASTSTPDNLIINANGLYIQKNQ
jgi:hypothetical protein